MRRWNVAKGAYLYFGVFSAIFMIAAENAKADLIRSGPERAVSGDRRRCAWRGVVHLRSRRPNRHVSLDEHAVHDCRRLVAERRIRRDAQCARGSKCKSFDDVRLDPTADRGDSSNAYELAERSPRRGTSAELARRMPTAFGWNSATTLIFDLNIKITGGSFAQRFGTNACLAHQDRDRGRVAGSVSSLGSSRRGRVAHRMASPSRTVPRRRNRHTRHPARSPAALGLNTAERKNRRRNSLFYKTQKPSP